ERPDLQVKRHQRLEKAVVEKQVHEILLVPKRQPVLSPDKAKAVAQFQDELLQPPDQVILQLAFLQRAAKAEEFEIVAAFERFLRLLRKMRRQRPSEIVRLFLRARPLISGGLDLVQQDVARPAELRGGLEVVKPGGGSFDLFQQFQVMTPW